MFKIQTKTMRPLLAARLSAALLLCASLPASAGLIYGTAARTQFDNFATTLGDTYESFDGYAGQTNLTTQIPGATFRTTIDGTGYHTSSGSRGTPVNLEVNVICSLSQPFNSTPCPSDHLIGGVRSGGVTDGQSVYEITFGSGQLRAGLTRNFFNTFMLTRFYSGSTLLAEHQSTATEEFVGFISDAANLITRIEMDGLFQVTNPSSGLGVYHVGYSDDLFFGATPLPQTGGSVPEPSAFALLLTGMVGLLGINRRRSPDVEKYQRIS